MRNISQSLSRVCMFLFALTVVIAQPVIAKEFVIMNRVISWDINSGDAFWSFKPDASMPSNWISPDNFYNGTIYTRYEVLSVASNEPFGLQFDLFQWKNPQHTIEGELCENVRWMNNGAGTVVTSSSSPSGWWRVNEGVDFSKIYDLQSLSVTIWCNDPQAPVSKAFQGGDDAGIAWSKRFKWFPVEVRVTIVAVSYGSTFSGWDNYITDPADQKPKPAYGIDFINETTDIPFSVNDEYSMFPEMTYSVNGTGEPVQLAPGRRYYFRTKAGDGLLASPLQILHVPERPATPIFTLDVANNRTSVPVNSSYEYSDNPDMSDAISGSDDCVTVAPGTTKYFRTKASDHSFCSNIQALNSSYKAPVPHEFVIFNDVIEYPNTTDTNGFYYFWHNADMPVNWLTPDNYYNGEVYVRYEIISQKTSTPVGLQIGIWQKLLPESGELYETMSEVKTLNGPGSIVTAHSSPSAWWKLNGGVDYSRMNLTWHFGINPWKVSTNQQIRQENPTVWNERQTYWFPMKVYVTVVAVASGHNFSGWENYLNITPAPSYGIDYVNETTDKIVPSTDQYANNSAMSGSLSGSGQKLTLIPGNDLYFRTAGHDNTPASDIQHLTVPSRPAIPEFKYDTEHQRTSVQVSNAFEYSSSPSMSEAISGSGNYVSFASGTSIYFRRKATSSSFKSEIQELKGLYEPPAMPQNSVDFINERTVTPVASTDEYSTNQVIWTTGSGVPVTLTPGTDLFIRKKAQGYYPPSDTLRLEVPARSTAPTFSIDFLYEETGEIVSNSYQYDTQSSMVSALVGNGQYLELTPGTTIYFRKKSTEFTFASEIQTLSVPQRPSAPNFTINFDSEATQSPVTSDYLYSENASMSGAASGGNQLLNLVPGTTIYFKKKNTGSSFASEIQTLHMPERPVAPSFDIDYDQEKIAPVFTSEYEYANNPEMNNPVPGNGSNVMLVPGTTLYLRKCVTPSSFASSVQTLQVPLRPAIPAYTINFAEEKINEPISVADDYANNSAMTGKIAGSNWAINLTPGSDLYFRTRSTPTSFCSDIHHLPVPERPVPPVFTINYLTETTNEIVSDQIEYSERNDFENSSLGTGEKLILQTGHDLYFRKIAGANSFRSNSSFLNVTVRNTLDYFGNDTIASGYFSVKANIKDGSEFSLEDLMISNGTASNLRSGNVFDVYPQSAGFVYVVIPSNAVSENSFSSNIVKVYYNPITGSRDDMYTDVEIFPNPVSEGFVNVSIETAYDFIIEVVSSSGLMLKSVEGISGMNKIDLSGLPGGLYFITLRGNGQNLTRKLIIAN